MIAIIIMNYIKIISKLVIEFARGILTSCLSRTFTYFILDLIFYAVVIFIWIYWKIIYFGFYIPLKRASKIHTPLNTPYVLSGLE